jgi:predicted amidohydrolase
LACDVGGAPACYGLTVLGGPWDHVFAKAEDKVGYVAARLDIEEVERIRARMPCADHRVRCRRFRSARWSPGGSPRTRAGRAP